MQVNTNPNPFDPGLGFIVIPVGGVPPYQIVLETSPPNPPGTTLTLIPPDRAFVDVPTSTPSKVQVKVIVQDSSNPPQVAEVVNRTR